MRKHFRKGDVEKDQSIIRDYKKWSYYARGRRKTWMVAVWNF
jgi:hypothetical protein